MWLCSVDIDERNKDGWDGDFGAGEDIGDKGGECGVLRAARERAPSVGGRGATHGIVDGVNHAVDDILWKGDERGWVRERKRTHRGGVWRA